MAFYLDTITFQPELSTGTTGFLLGEVMNKIVAEINVYAEWYSAATATTDTFSFTNGGYTITRLDNTKSFITDGFKVGDSIQITNANAANNILTTITDVTVLTITCADPFGFTEDSDTAEVHGVTPITDCDFFYNRIKNSESTNFVSLIDGSIQRMNGTGLDCTDTTPIALSFMGASKAWVNGSATIEGTAASDWADPGTGDFKQSFKITHTFNIIEYFVASQESVTSIEAGVPLPDRFNSTECLRYCFEIDGYFNALDTSKKHTLVYNGDNGNTGYFNERFNGFPAYYTMGAITYTDTLTSDSVTGIQYCKDTDFSFSVYSAGDKFSDGNTELVINFSYLPQSTIQYENTTTDFETNYMFDRAKQTLGAAAVNGDNYGTATQVLTNIEATYVDAGEIIITGTVSLATGFKTAIQAASTSNRNYLFAVEVQDHTKTTTQSDRVTCWNNVSDEFTCDLDQNVLLVSDYVMFNDHPKVGTASGFSSIVGWIEDGVLMHAVFGIDQTDSPTLDKISVVFETEHATYTGFELERKDIIGLLNSSRNFKLPTNNEKNWVRLIRRADLDYGDYDFYQIFYAVKLRWEDWINVSVPTPTNIPAIKQKQDWCNFSTIVSGWSVNCNLYVYTTIDDYQTTHKHISNCTIYDYNKPRPQTGYIETFDQSGNNTNLTILGYEDTHVKATFQLPVGVSFPANMYGILEIERYQIDGIQNIRQISSMFPPESGSPWIGDPVNNLATVTEVGSTITTVEADLDYTKIDTNIEDWKLSARLGPRSKTAISIPGTSMSFAKVGIEQTITSDLVIDWGDGNTDYLSGLTDEITHAYTTASDYTISLETDYPLGITNLVLRSDGINSIGSINELMNLEVLDIANNALNTIPSLQGLINLKEVYFDNNGMSQAQTNAALMEVYYLHYNYGITDLQITYLGDNEDCDATVQAYVDELQSDYKLQINPVLYATLDVTTAPKTISIPLTGVENEIIYIDYGTGYIQEVVLTGSAQTVSGETFTNTQIYKLRISGYCNHLTQLNLSTGAESNFTSIDFNDGTKLSDINLYDSALTTTEGIEDIIGIDTLNLQNNAIADMDAILIQLDDSGVINGDLRADGGTNEGEAALTVSGAAAKASLITKGWTIIMNA